MADISNSRAGDNDIYQIILAHLKDLKIDNHVAECCIKDVQEYANLTINSAYRYGIF